MKKKLFIVFAIVGVLASCSKGDDETPEQFLFTTASGARISLDGNWQANCVPLEGVAISEVFTFSGNQITLTIDTYQAGGCDQAPIESDVIRMTFTLGATYNATLDGSSVIVNEIQGSSTSETTRQTENFKQAIFIDDIDGNMALYHGVFSDDGGAINANGFPMELHPVAIIKQ